MQKMTNALCLTTLLVGITILTSCNNATEKQPAATTPEAKLEIPTPVRETILTAEQQQALTPAMVLESLKEGNKRFVANNVTARDHSAMVRAAVAGQFPKSVILSCLDSRIPVEDVFDKGIGDMFVARVAGNIINEDILGSMEFGCKAMGARLIVVMGHSSCGAINSAIDGVKLGNITAMLARVQPAVAMSQSFDGEKKSSNAAFTDVVGKNNVLHAIEEIKKNSPILKEMLDKGTINIVGAYYSMQTGEVTFL
jgi:carbonic anhydrase